MSGRLRDRFLPGLLTLVGPAIVRTLGRTWKVSRHGFDPYVERKEGRSTGRCIVGFWHSDILPLAYIHRDEQATTLISKHGDGELIARVAIGLGFNVVRGSSTRGGSGALREMVRIAKHGSGEITLTPDGPKGPARRAQPGVAYVSALTGFPLLPLAMVAKSAWRFRSWDRFGIPKPFTRVVAVSGEPIRVPREAAKGDVSPWLRRYEEQMKWAEEEAARIVAGEEPSAPAESGAGEPGAKPAPLEPSA